VQKLSSFVSLNLLTVQPIFTCKRLNVIKGLNDSIPNADAALDNAAAPYRVQGHFNLRNANHTVDENNIIRNRLMQPVLDFCLHFNSSKVYIVQLSCITTRLILRIAY